MNEMSKVFGYGSLVNNETMPNGTVSDVKDVKISGYSRDWCCPVYVDGVRYLALGIHRSNDLNEKINGVAFSTDYSGMTYLKFREIGYERSVVSTIDVYGNIEECTTFSLSGCRYGYIALSYLCTVVEGFRSRSGEQGVREFFESTGFSRRTILRDLEHPKYKRMPASAACEARAVRNYIENHTSAEFVSNTDCTTGWIET